MIDIFLFMKKYLNHVSRKNTLPFNSNLKVTSIHGLVLKILYNQKRPMTIFEITEKVKKIKKFKGKTPYQTISAVLQRSKYTKRVNRGIYKIINVPN